MGTNAPWLHVGYFKICNLSIRLCQTTDEIHTRIQILPQTDHTGFKVNYLRCPFQTQSMMYDLVSELQHRSEELDRRIVALEEKLDSILLGVQSLPVVLSQAITKLQKDFLDDLACRVHFLSSSLSAECCSVPARQICPGSATPETPYSS